MIEIRSTTNKSALLLFFVLACSLLFSQEKKTEKNAPKDEKSQFTFKVPVDVVVVNASVTDKSGKPVLDLTADDFKVYEDGKPQPIHTFTLESYKSTQVVQIPNQKPAEAGKPQEKVESPPTASQGRMFSLLIDDITTPNDLYPRAIEAMRRFVEEDIVPGDLVAIVSGSGSVQYPFTSDKQLLLAQVNGLYKHLYPRPVAKSQCPQLTDLQAQRIFDEVSDGISLETAVTEATACANLQQGDPMAKTMARNEASNQYHQTEYNNRTLLQVLRQHVKSLKHFESKKSLILLSDGFLFQDLIYDLQAVIDQALRAGVVINTVDVRGLYVPMIDASMNVTTIDPTTHAEFLSEKSRLLREDMASQDDSLVMLAHDSGGIFFHNSNDLHAGLKQVSDRETHYYVLSYATPSQKADGRYHKIKVEISRPGVEVTCRKGYYAPKEELSFERKRKEDILDALRAPGNANEIPVGFSYNSSQIDDSNFEVELVTRVDIRRIRFVEEDSWKKNQISVVMVALDERDRYIDGTEKDVSFSLSPQSYSELLIRGFSTKISLRMPPGHYKVKAVIREGVQNKVGSLSKVIEVP